MRKIVAVCFIALLCLCAFGQTSSEIQKCRQLIKYCDNQIETARRQFGGQSKEFNEAYSLYRKTRDEALRHLDELEHSRQDVARVNAMVQEQMQQITVAAEELNNSFSAGDFMQYRPESQEMKVDDSYEILEYYTQRQTGLSRAEMLIPGEENPTQSSLDKIDWGKKEIAEIVPRNNTQPAIIIEPNKPFEFKYKQTTVWTDEMSQQYGNQWRPVLEEGKDEYNYSHEECEAWDALGANISERQRDMLAINLMIMNGEKIPTFVGYSDNGELIMMGKKGKVFLVSSDGKRISEALDIEHDFRDGPSDIVSYYNEKSKYGPDEFPAGKKMVSGDVSYLDGGKLVDSKVVVTLINHQDKKERKWMYVGEVLEGDIGGSYSSGLKSEISGKAQISLPETAVKYAGLQAEGNQATNSTQSLKTGYQTIGANGSVGADMTIGEAKGSLAAGMAVKVAGLYIIPKAKGEVSASAGASAKAEVSASIGPHKGSNKWFELKGSGKAALGVGAGAKGNLEVYVFSANKLHDKIPTLQ